jgi:1,4-alpha-glucan branching enzyme
MLTSQAHIFPGTPMGATLVADGATFRVWAPGATQVYVVFNGHTAIVPQASDELLKNDATGHWTGFIAGVTDGSLYRFWIVGPGGAGLKRDPYARELELHGWPEVDCIVRDPDSYPWHDAAFQPPPFNDLIVYQFHVGTFYARDAQGSDIRRGRVAKFLDVLDRLNYLADLGVNAIQPLPLVEHAGEWSLGYNGTDLFSPEMDYCVDPDQLRPYLAKVNQLLAAKHCAPLTLTQLSPQINQLKAFIDLCHLYGLAVLADLVYNHAGGGLDAQSIDYFDLPAHPDKSNSLYFSERGWAGGRMFAFQKEEVQSFLIDNAKMFVDEYHVDGFRFDEVSVIDDGGGWFFAQNITSTLRYQDPRRVQIAEYWKDQRWLAVTRAPQGMGFDIGYADAVRDQVRQVLAQAAGGRDAPIELGRLKNALLRPFNFTAAWQAYNCIENHDLVLDADGDHRKPRIARLADGSDPRSWFARSRARVATGLLLTAPGVPMLFMGQELLEDQLWSDDPNKPDDFIGWDGFDGAQPEPQRVNQHRFTRDLLWLRRHHPALRGEHVNAFHLDQANRILAYHRWLEGTGRDVVVVISLKESTFYERSYVLGFPLPGSWHEVFNSDVYDNFPNPWVQGNSGGVWVDGPGTGTLAHSAGITIPANSVLVFARDRGD